MRLLAVFIGIFALIWWVLSSFWWVLLLILGAGLWDERHLTKKPHRPPPPE